jgi:signal peptidase II
MGDTPPPPTPAAAPERTSAHPEASIGSRVAKYRLLWIAAFSTFVLDQLTKYWIITALPYGAFGGERGSPTVIPGFFYLAHVGNPGAAWSMFPGGSTWLGVLAAITLVAIFFGRHALGLRDRTSQFAFGLLCGGIAGNLTDRVAHHGLVVDFLDFHFGSYIYPTFNVADSGICVGVLLYLWHSLFSRRPAS